MAALAVRVFLSIGWRVTNGEYGEFVTLHFLATLLIIQTNGRPPLAQVLLIWVEKWSDSTKATLIVGDVGRKFHEG